MLLQTRRFEVQPTLRLCHLNWTHSLNHASLDWHDPLAEREALEDALLRKHRDGDYSADSTYHLLKAAVFRDEDLPEETQNEPASHCNRDISHVQLYMAS